jgi:hypothetical protein
VLQLPFDGAQDGRERRERRGFGRRRRCSAKQGEGLEVEDAPDRWAPPVGDHVREREGSGALAGLLGRKRGAGPRRGEKEKEGRWAAGWVWG